MHLKIEPRNKQNKNESNQTENTQFTSNRWSFNTSLARVDRTISRSVRKQKT